MLENDVVDEVVVGEEPVSEGSLGEVPADEAPVDEVPVKEEAPNPYRSKHYLLFGTGVEGSDIWSNAEGAADYLRGVGFAESALTKARRQGKEANRYAGYRDPSAHFCDFCGKELAAAFDVLKDGRERCGECSKTVVKNKKDFEVLFGQVREGMCLKYGIDLPTPIAVKVVSQSKMAKMQGSKFVPTKYYDPRAVGLAVNRGGSYSMMFENGTPRVSLVSTAAHELTHIWQYSHWDWGAMQAKYGRHFLMVCEGMAQWAEIQYLYLLNETTLADRFLMREAAREDVYGYGLRLFANQYPISKGICLNGDTPFMHPDNPIEL